MLTLSGPLAPALCIPSLSRGATPTITASKSFSIQSVLTGTNGMIKAGTGTLGLFAAATYTGDTLIQNGSIQPRATNALPTSTNVVIGLAGTANSGTLDVRSNQTIAGLSAVGTTLANEKVSQNQVTGTTTLTGNPSGATTPTDSIFGGVIQNGDATHLLAITKAGSNTLTLTGTNTYTGKTTVSGGVLLLNKPSGAGNVISSTGGAATSAATTDVQITGGTLQLGASNQIVNTATIGLSGGMLSLAGNSEGGAGTTGVGALTLSATSTLDFGAATGSNLIQFAGLGTHTGGTILKVTNWEGAPGSANGTDRLLFAGTATDFTNAYTQSEVSFNGTAGYGVLDFTGGYYEVYAIAVPEPASYISASLFVAAMAWSYSRKRQRVTA